VGNFTGPLFRRWPTTLIGKIHRYNPRHLSQSTVEDPVDGICSRVFLSYLLMSRARENSGCALLSNIHIQRHALEGQSKKSYHSDRLVNEF